MNLDEAKQELIEHGYKVELNEDLRKAWDEVKDSVSDALVDGMRKLSPKVQQFIQDTIPLGAALKEAGTIYGFRVEKEEGFYKLTVRNKHTSTAPDFLYVKGFRGNIEVNIDGEGWTTKTIKVHSKKELMDLLKIVWLSLGSLLALFILTKIMGNKEMSQLSMFDYIIGITIGSQISTIRINPINRL